MKENTPQRDMVWHKALEQLALTEPNPNQAEYNLPQLKRFINSLLSQVIEDIVPPEFPQNQSLVKEVGWNAARTYSLGRSKKWVKTK